MAAGEGDPGVEREARITRSKDKTKKHIRYASRRACAEMRPRIKGRFAKEQATSQPSPELPRLPDNASVASLGNVRSKYTNACAQREGGRDSSDG